MEYAAALCPASARGGDPAARPPRGPLRAHAPCPAARRRGPRARRRPGALAGDLWCCHYLVIYLYTLYGGYFCSAAAQCVQQCGAVPRPPAATGQPAAAPSQPGDTAHTARHPAHSTQHPLSSPGPELDWTQRRGYSPDAPDVRLRAKTYEPSGPTLSALTSMASPDRAPRSMRGPSSRPGCACCTFPVHNGGASRHSS